MLPTRLGLYSTRDLNLRGLGRADLTRAVNDGDLWHVHRGWYAVPGTDAQAIRAMRLGGRLGCVSALRLHGAWVPADAGLHIAMPPHASGRRSRRSVPDLEGESIVRHWHTAAGEQSFDVGVSAISDAVAQAALCQPVGIAVAVLDSVIHRRLMTHASVEAVLMRLPRSRSSLTRLIDERSEEGIESLARVALMAAGLDVVPQVVIEGVGRVDLLVNGWLVVELDGRETHAQQRAFVSDRRRIAALGVRSYQYVAFTYPDVVYDVDALVETVRQIVALHAPTRTRAVPSAGSSADDRRRAGF